VQDVINILKDDKKTPGSVLHTIETELSPILEELEEHEKNIGNNTSAIAVLKGTKDTKDSILYTINAETEETRKAVETNRQAIELLKNDDAT
jgi:hypothetical protein